MGVRRALNSLQPDVVMAFVPMPCMYAELAGLPGRKWGLIVGERHGIIPAMVGGRALRQLWHLARHFALWPIDRVWMTFDRVGYARHLGVRIGEGCAIWARPDIAFGQEPYLVTLGNHVFISAGVQFVNHDSAVWVLRERDQDSEVYAPITVGNNVFIGLRAIILPGVSVGDNVIIGAGAVVTRDIPSGSVAAGVPATVRGTIDDYAIRVRARSLPIHHLKGPAKVRYLKEWLRNQPGR